MQTKTSLMTVDKESNQQVCFFMKEVESEVLSFRFQTLRDHIYGKENNMSLVI